MALYTIGDLHLSFSSDKPMDVFGPRWKDHTDKLINNFNKLSNDDVTVVCGDISWSIGTDESAEDFRFIDSLPGKKIILKGNHDYWFSTMRKINALFEKENIRSVSILNNNCFEYDDIAICGTKGWFYEVEKNLLNREVMRLRASLEAAGDREKLVFLHYPPVYRYFHCEEIITILKEYNVRHCCYGHIHGSGLDYVQNGWMDGIEYKCVSADYINFNPVCLFSD